MKPNTIWLEPVDNLRYDEINLSAAAKPGMAIAVDANGEGAPGVAPFPRILIEDALQGKGIDHSYATGDIGRVVTPATGHKILLVLKDGQEAVVGSRLAADATGKFIVSATGGFEALEAESPSGSDVFIRARYFGG